LGFRSSLLLLFLLICVPVYGGTWRDDFNGEELKRCWKSMGGRFKWEVRDGFLHVKQNSTSNFIGPLRFLRLKAFPGIHKRFTITVTNLKARKSHFGVALGRSFPEIITTTFFWYLFFTNSIYARRADGVTGDAPFLTWAPRSPGTRWDTRELKEVKITFDSGRFQMMADGEKRADFEDPHFDVIELIAFAMWGHKFPGPEGWADSFEISGPSITGYEVKPKGKLATTWGSIKGR
jgi:hypothetical protein